MILQAIGLSTGKLGKNTGRICPVAANTCRHAPWKRVKRVFFQGLKPSTYFAWFVTESTAKQPLRSSLTFDSLPEHPVA
jgi:hypothetical protein